MLHKRSFTVPSRVVYAIFIYTISLFVFVSLIGIGNRNGNLQEKGNEEVIMIDTDYEVLHDGSIVDSSNVDRRQQEDDYMDTYEEVSGDECEIDIESSFTKTSDLTELEYLIKDTEKKYDSAKALEHSARNLGMSELIDEAIEIYQYNLDANVYYKECYNEAILSFEPLYAEYPVATEVWVALKSNGYSDVVCAGILGNMMAECGGHTLYLNYSIYDSLRRYYGLCQWDKKYCEEVYGVSLIEQIEYLLDTIEDSINLYGDYDKFISCKDEKSAALMFAKYYERCTSYSYTIRQSNATKALDIFSKI